MAIGMLISAAGIVGLTSVESLWLYTPLFLVTGIGLGLGWALANVATQAVVPPEFVGAASGITLTSLVMLGAVGVAIGAAMLEVLAGSPAPRHPMPRRSTRCCARARRWRSWRCAARAARGFGDAASPHPNLRSE